MRMKDSGIEWIGEIPEDWELEKMKYHMRINPVFSNDANAIDDDAEVSFVPMENLHNGFHEVSTMPYSKMKTGYTEFREGDILIAKVTPCFENGNIAEAKNLLSGRGFGSTEILVIRCPKKYARYIYYYLQNPAFKIRAISEMYGVAGLKRIPPTFFKESYIPIPSDNQQVKIADFLDSRCAEIDAVIAAKQRQNDLLKEQRQSIIFEAVTKGLDPTVTYKDSGVEWIGEIPEDWEVRRIKHIARFSGGGTPSKERAEFWDGDIPWVSPKDMKCELISDSEDKITDEGLKQSSGQLVLPGAVLIVVRSGILKHTIPVAINAVSVSLNQDMKAVTLDPMIMTSVFFLRWVQGLNSILLNEWVKIGATVDSIEHDYLANTIIAHPPLLEQQQIADYLDIRCAELDRVVAANNAVIDKLKEYRQSLIYEAVTGKIAV